jgi:hypothetical protein
LSAATWGVVGALAAAVAVAVLGSNQTYLRTAIHPVLGCAAVFACAGWAASSPRPTYGFAESLAIVFFGSIFLWTMLAALEVTPRRLKAVEHPLVYPSEAFALLGAPILVAGLLTALRCADRPPPMPRKP